MPTTLTKAMSKKTQFDRTVIKNLLNKSYLGDKTAIIALEAFSLAASQNKSMSIEFMEIVLDWITQARELVFDSKTVVSIKGA